MTSPTMACPACPDGNEWTPEGMTGRACQVCGGHAEVRLDGSRIDGREIQEREEIERGRDFDRPAGVL